MAAMLVPERSAASLTAALDEVVANAQRSFGSELGEAELHGYDLISGKRDWSPLATKVRARIGVYDRALRALADHGIRIIIRSVDIPGLDERHPTGHDHPHAVVLSHLVERIDEHLERIDDVGLLIADEVDGQDAYRRDLWTYQRSATKGYRSRQITRVVDALHFAPSSSSRLLQGGGSHRLPGPSSGRARRARCARSTSQRDALEQHCRQHRPRWLLVADGAGRTKALTDVRA